jgi:ribonucleoside-diphosphate reductase alpha subunit
MTIVHPDYSKLASRIAVTKLHKETPDTFYEAMRLLREYKDVVGRPAPLISEEVYEIIQANHEEIEKVIDFQRDHTYDFFGFKTLERSYLLKVDNKIVERPQTMIMRVSIGIHKTDLESVFETYNLMSEKWFTHATPTLFNSGTPKPQMSSCFLLAMRDDSIEGIFETLQQCAIISKNAGGIGLAVHCIRSTSSYIRGTNGRSNGLVPMLRVFNDCARYVDQGGGKRKGAFAIYLEPWHPDIYEFLNLKKNTGKEENRARDLFYALWCCDLFMRRVEADENWTLFCPNECPELFNTWGEKFEKIYEAYELEGRGRKTVKAMHLWNAIIESQIETGVPYMLYKDSANGKSNQQNLGTIKSSNLCCEIMEYTDKDQVAVCNLASISLSMFADLETGEFDYERLHSVTRTITKNLNRVIDNNYYPVPEAKYSNFRNRPIGIGVQGLADAFQKMKIPYEDERATDVNKKIFETIYHAAMTMSLDLAKSEGPYETFQGSPLSEGKFQFDLWNVKPYTDRYDWDSLREEVKVHGVRNSLLVAPMPTASTSQVLGNNESFEPYTSNVYTRRVLAGEFVCVNQHLVKDLIKEGLWTWEVKNALMGSNGSVQGIKGIPDHLKKLYKTIWEIPQKTLLNLSIDRAPYICQSQSLNVYMAEPTFAKMSAMHFYAWKNGLKTGQYYLRSQGAADSIKFTVDVGSLINSTETGNAQILSALSKNNEANKVKKRIRVKKSKTKENDIPEKEEEEEPKACPRRRAGDEEDCFACGS